MTEDLNPTDAQPEDVPTPSWDPRSILADDGSYTVTDEDQARSVTITDLAEHFYGSGSAWREIYNDPRNVAQHDSYGDHKRNPDPLALTANAGAALVAGSKVFIP